MKESCLYKFREVFPAFVTTEALGSITIIATGGTHSLATVFTGGGVTIATERTIATQTTAHVGVGGGKFFTTGHARLKFSSAGERMCEGTIATGRTISTMCT
jgi:hypothetical protein